MDRIGSNKVVMFPLQGDRPGLEAPPNPPKLQKMILEIIRPSLISIISILEAKNSTVALANIIQAVSGCIRHLDISIHGEPRAPFAHVTQ